MCGIAGVLMYNNKTVNEDVLTASREMLLHRGPDVGANYINDNIGLAHRRLKIIDLLPRANQPMISEDNNFIIVYNGEIYNFHTLKKHLQTKGYYFKTETDTEVLLNMFIEYGDNMLPYLNGMFAFAIWDNTKKELFIARDRVGIKPLFYQNNAKFFSFASEVKAIIKNDITDEIDENALNEILFFRHVSGENTIFSNVYRLLPGYYLKVNVAGIKEKKQWWNLKEKIQHHSFIKKPLHWFFETFNQSVKQHMISDVPVGILLSGGLDSSSIAASLKQQNFQNVKTFNVGFNNFKFDETNIAKKFSSSLEFPFYNINVVNDDLIENTIKAAITLDDTFVHQNEPQLIAISKYAQQYVKVLLSGEGSDELLGGYVRYKALNYFIRYKKVGRFIKYIPSFVKFHRLNKLEKYYQLKSIEQAILFNAVNNYPTEFKRFGITLKEYNYSYRSNILKDAKELYPNSFQRQTMYLDTHTYLQTLNDRNDRTTMAASIECRVPFLNHELIEGLGTLPDEYFVRGNKGKYLLTETFKNILPKYVTNFQKIGFSVPWMKYIRENEYFTEQWNNMHQSPILNMGFYKLINISSLKKQYAQGDKSIESLLRQMFFLSMWYQQYVEGNKRIVY